MSDPTQAAEKLGLTVWDYIADPQAVNKGEAEREALRKAANDFLFHEDVRKSDAPGVLEARKLAHAVLAWLYADCAPESFRRLQRASQIYERTR